MDIKEKVRKFILENISAADLDDDADMFEQGLVRSMFVMQLVVFVERDFGIAVSGDDLNFDYFRTVEAITGLVTRKLAV